MIPNMRVVAVNEAIFVHECGWMKCMKGTNAMGQYSMMRKGEIVTDNIPTSADARVRYVILVVPFCRFILIMYAMCNYYCRSGWLRRRSKYIQDGN